MGFSALENDGRRDPLNTSKPGDTLIQVVFALAIGLSAFLGFCFLRPKWPALYAARKRHKEEAFQLPALGDSFFGWTVILWRITEEQVLASAGLDAYVFLRFFKMAIKFLTITLFFALVVIKPVHDANPDNNKHKSGHDRDEELFSSLIPQTYPASPTNAFSISKGKHGNESAMDYLWMYLVFVYLFTGVAMYLLIKETEKIIDVRQEYLGHKSSVTGRTIRLSGIPKELRSEEKIKNFIEELEIGKVESVTLCRQWQELDDAMDQRIDTLRRLEEALTVYHGHRIVERSRETLPIAQPSPPSPTPRQPRDGDDESEPLLGPEPDHDAAEASRVPYDRQRPHVYLPNGFFNLKRKKVDAIDYYEERLRQADEKIQFLRKKEFEPTPLAFVTLDSVAACQMAAQAVLDPSPMHLMAKPSPAPDDIIWRNTYMPRSRRMLRGWTITIAIGVLSIFWGIILAPIAGLSNVETIKKVWPELGSILKRHKFAQSLVVTQLPTLLTSLLFVVVPFLYDWLSTFQGMTSQGDVELSVISKNFFFVFFNYFIFYTILGTFANFYEFLEKFQAPLKDPTHAANLLAQALQKLLPFYTNLIILQGVGLLPLRLLEFGSVALYPLYRMGAKTPRDYAELVQPPVFNYGLYLPQVMLVFVVSIVYSILRESWQVLLAGLLFFIFGSFVYKYQLLYAMDHQQHSTGKAWIMICSRMIIGLVLCQLTVGGELALKRAWARAALVIPLIIATIWFYYVYSRSYNPLMRFIALRSIERTRSEEPASPMDPDGWGAEAHIQETGDNQSQSTAAESQTSIRRFINPNLVLPLEPAWIKSSDQPQNAEN